MLTNQEIFQRCSGAVYKARSLREAANAYYVNPFRDSLLGMIASAKLEGYSMELVTTVLGMCGKMEFPPQERIATVLVFLLDEMRHDEQDLRLWAKLSSALENNSPVDLSDEELNTVASVLSWSCPMGGETEAILASFFPNLVSLPSVFRRKAEEISERDTLDPHVLIRQLLAKNTALEMRIARLSFGR